jgi:hypothetical protein
MGDKNELGLQICQVNFVPAAIFLLGASGVVGLYPHFAFAFRFKTLLDGSGGYFWMAETDDGMED